jgi:hypothetical protein
VQVGHAGAHLGLGLDAEERGGHPVGDECRVPLLAQVSVLLGALEKLGEDADPAVVDLGDRPGEVRLEHQPVARPDADVGQDAVRERVAEVDDGLQAAVLEVDEWHLRLPLLLDERHRELLLGGEVEVERALGDARLGQDLRQAGAGEASPVEDLGRGVEDRVSSAFGPVLTCQNPHLLSTPRVTPTTRAALESRP